VQQAVDVLGPKRAATMKRPMMPRSAGAYRRTWRAGRPSRPPRPASWYSASSEFGRFQCQTERTSALSTPIPNALVEAITASRRREGLLRGPPVLGRHPGVVAEAAELLAQSVDRPTRAGVDDRRPRVRSGETATQERQARAVGACLEHVEDEVRPVEARPHLDGVRRRRRRAVMSRATAGVAVAVSAIVARAPKRSRTSASRP
jgi:hypothetical protein